MFRVLAGAALALLLLLAGAAPPRAAAQEVTLKVAHFLPPASTAHAKFIAPWCEKIARESNNRLRCQIFPAMQLGGTPPQLFDQVRDGVADIVWSTRRTRSRSSTRSSRWPSTYTTTATSTRATGPSARSRTFAA